MSRSKKPKFVKKGFTLREDQEAFIRKRAAREGHFNESRIVQDIVREFQEQAAEINTSTPTTPPCRLKRT